MNAIRHYDDDNDLLVRDGLVMAFFCKRPFDEIAPGVEKAFDRWLEVVPEGSLKWALVGANATSHKKISSQTVERCRALLDPAQAAQREMTAFEIQGEEKYNPAFLFLTTGNQEMPDDDPKTNLVEMRFPSEFLEEFGEDAFVDLAAQIAGLLPYDSGYASPALNWGIEPEKEEAGEIIVPLALRHPGFDVHDNDNTRFSLGTRSRGARWLTFLSKDLVDDLGRREALVGRLDAGIDVLDAGDGLALRAGAQPEIGDVNRKKDVPLLKSVARAIEKVTFFDDDGLEEIFMDDAEKLDRWEHRFLG